MKEINVELRNRIIELSKPYKGSIWSKTPKGYYNSLLNFNLEEFPCPMEYKPKLPLNLQDLLVYDSIDHFLTYKEFTLLYKDHPLFLDDLEIFNYHVKKCKNKFNLLINQLNINESYDTYFSNINNLKRIYTHIHLIAIIYKIKVFTLNILKENYLGLFCIKNEAKMPINFELLNLFRKLKIGKINDLSEIIYEYRNDPVIYKLIEDKDATKRAFYEYLKEINQLE